MVKIISHTNRPAPLVSTERAWSHPDVVHAPCWLGYVKFSARRLARVVTKKFIRTPILVGPGGSWFSPTCHTIFSVDDDENYFSWRRKLFSHSENFSRRWENFSLTDKNFCQWWEKLFSLTKNFSLWWKTFLCRGKLFSASLDMTTTSRRRDDTTRHVMSCHVMSSSPTTRRHHDRTVGPGDGRPTWSGDPPDLTRPDLTWPSRPDPTCQDPTWPVRIWPDLTRPDLTCQDLTWPGGDDQPVPPARTDRPDRPKGLPQEPPNPMPRTGFYPLPRIGLKSLILGRFLPCPGYLEKQQKTSLFWGARKQHFPSISKTDYFDFCKFRRSPRKGTSQILRFWAQTSMSKPDPRFSPIFTIFLTF